MTLFKLGPLRVIRNPQRPQWYIVCNGKVYLDFIPYPGQTGLGMAISKCYDRKRKGIMR